MYKETKSRHGAMHYILHFTNELAGCAGPELAGTLLGPAVTVTAIIAPAILLVTAAAAAAGTSITLQFQFILFLLLAAAAAIRHRTPRP